jgi:DNA polymerase-3 subunit epsilon
MQRSALASPRFAFVDLETSGISAAVDRITEIGMVLVDDEQVVEEWSSLVHPGCAIPPDIQALTGITNAMVRDAPPFEALLPSVLQRLDNRLLVAHNARFDYGFLKAECRRVGVRFNADVLCTVRLSRKLYPQFKTHSLDALIQRHALHACERHRALADARLIAQFIAHVRQQVTPAAVQHAIQELLKLPALPAHLDEASVALLRTLPESPGVYTFLGLQGQPLYIGKARNLRERVRAHFYADSRHSNDARLATETHALQIEPTGGEFTALLREMQAIKTCAPLHNVALRKRASVCFLEADVPGHTPRIVALERLAPPHPSSEGRMRYGPFGSRSGARAVLAQLGRTHRLCDAALGLKQGNGPCFSRQIHRCEGLCEGAETPQTHHARLLSALEPWAFPSWPYAGPVALQEHDPESGLTQTVVFDQWCAWHGGQTQAFDVDIFRLLRRHIARQPERFTPLNPNSGLTGCSDAVLDCAPESDHN